MIKKDAGHYSAGNWVIWVFAIVGIVLLLLLVVGVLAPKSG